MESLAIIARRVGHPLALVKLTYTELMAVPGPVLAYTEPEGIGSGTLCLVHAEPKWVDTVDGLVLRFRQSTAEDFQREWTGYALIPQQATSSGVILRRCGAVLLSFSLALGMLRFRNRCLAL